MNTKLTLSLDKRVIEKAKDYAKQQNISLSSIIENYLLKIVSELQGELETKGSIVEELSGIIQLNDNAYKDDHSNYTED